MTIRTSPYVQAPVTPRRASLAAAPAPALSANEADRITAAFPEKPAVVQRLSGADRNVRQPAALGTRLDLSA